MSAIPATEHLRQAQYLAQRIGRNLLPGPVARWARRLARLSPGGETTAPQEIAEYYRDTLEEEMGFALDGKKVLLFGFGGHLGVACRLLRMGAAHVYLYDKFATFDHRLNARLLPEFEEYLARESEAVRPRPKWLTHLRPTSDEAAPTFPEVDAVLSLTVLEHVDDPPLWIDRLAAATAGSGVHLHHVDLRDHLFATPFEMLCYRESTWRRWLNPRRSNLNRWRLRDHESLFRRLFEHVEVVVKEREPEAFDRTRARIRPEFLTGNREVDSATAIQIRARWPRPRS